MLCSQISRTAIFIYDTNKSVFHTAFHTHVKNFFLEIDEHNKKDCTISYSLFELFYLQDFKILIVESRYIYNYSFSFLTFNTTIETTMAADNATAI